MELKFIYMLYNIFCGGCSNRTFMELKWSINLVVLRLLKSSNRTFMELKFCNITIHYTIHKF